MFPLTTYGQYYIWVLAITISKRNKCYNEEKGKNKTVYLHMTQLLM